MENSSAFFWKNIFKLSDHLEQLERFLRTSNIMRLSNKAVSGDLVYFGGYSWIVLSVDEEEGKFLLLTRQLLAIMPMKYHGEKVDVTWENADIRKYLRDVFYEKFSNEDRKIIQDTNVINSSTPWFDTPGGNGTVDKFFLLSLDELVKYLGDSNQLAKKSWPYEGVKDFSKPCFVSDEYNDLHKAINEHGESFQYWLRSAGRDGTSAAFVRADGTIDLAGEAVTAAAGVRPAVWVKL